MVDEAVTYNILSLLAYIKHQLRLMYFVHAPVLYVKLAYWSYVWIVCQNQ